VFFRIVSASVLVMAGWRCGVDGSEVIELRIGCFGYVKVCKLREALDNEPACYVY
jgi:hypothetical protein